MLERQFAGNAESRAAGMVINTMGWIEGVGYEVLTFQNFLYFKFFGPVCLMIFFCCFYLQLLLHAIDTFNANVVLVLGQVDAFRIYIYVYI